MLTVPWCETMARCRGPAPARWHGSGADRPSARRRRRGQGGDGAPVVPDAKFTSYYGRPVLKRRRGRTTFRRTCFLGGSPPAPRCWLRCRSDGRPALRRPAARRPRRITFGLAALVHDLGRPSRFRPHAARASDSPTSVGTWILSVYGPLASVEARAENRAGSPARGSDGQREFLGAWAARPGLGGRGHAAGGCVVHGPYCSRIPQHRRA